MALGEGAVGRSGFIAAFDLWNDEQREQAKQMLARVKAEKLDFVRLSFAGPSDDIDEALRRMEPWLRR